MTPSLWAVRAANLAVAFALSWLATRGLTISLLVPACVFAAVGAVDGVASFSTRLSAAPLRGRLALAACALDSALIVWLGSWMPGPHSDMAVALLVPAVLAALEQGPLVGVLLGAGPAALMSAPTPALAFFALVPLATALALPDARGRAAAEARETLARLRSAQVGEYLSFVMFQLRDYTITLSSVSQALGLSLPQDELKVSEKVQRLQHTVGELSGKLARLLGDKSALTMAQPTTQTAVDLPALTRAVVAEATAAFAPAGVEVGLIVQGKLPPVHSDRRSVELALLAVLQNSMEACAARGGGRISLLLRHEAGVAAIEVSDDGGGIAETVKPLVFEPFAASRAGAHGLGLGLPMSRRFLERIGGGLRLKSKGGCTAALLEIPVDRQLPVIRNEESTWAGRRA